MKMPFGKYGPKQIGGASDMEDVPANYLLWLHESGIAPGAVLEYIKKNLAGIKKQVADGKGDM